MGSTRPKMYSLQNLHKLLVFLGLSLSMTELPQHKLAIVHILLLEPVLHHFLKFVVKDFFN